MDINNLIKYIRQIDSTLLWIIAGISLSVFPHSQRMPIWITIAFLSLVCWRLNLTKESVNFYRSSLLLQITKLVIFLSIIIGILISYGTLVGRDAGVAFLILLGGMKVLESRQERDNYIIIFIALFLVLSNFLFTQTLPTAIYMFVILIALIAAMYSLNDDNDYLSTTEKLKRAGKLLIHAIPFALILFILFPRIPGPLWGLPRDVTAGISGLSDEMMPGSINELALSNEIAFRVKFDNSFPEFKNLYWRGPVLTKTDGFKWTQDNQRRLTKSITPVDNFVDYTVTLEPTNQSWLFALELPVTAPENSRLSHDLQIRKRSPITNLTQYSLRSWLDYKYTDDGNLDRQNSLQLPNNHHPKTRALAEKWRNEGLSQQEIIERALVMFSTEEFFYSLSPPLLLTDTVDEFLFETRIGFCEHYAATFVVLMRAAGIPSRVVTGYQGGTVNPLDNYLVVRQRDAHAWAEVYIDDQGWKRVDPTSAVAPSRILGGIENALPESIIDVPLGFQNSVAARNMWRQFRDAYEAVNNGWNQWVLSYDQRKQRNLFKNIGFGNLDWGALSILLVLCLGGLLLIFIYLLFRNKNKESDPVINIYNDFCLRLAKIGILRNRSEGPVDFSNRACALRTDLKDSITEIIDNYVAIRYANDTGKLDTLKNLVMVFKPGKETTN